jgi:hypothetical protein
MLDRESIRTGAIDHLLRVKDCDAREIANHLGHGVSAALVTVALDSDSRFRRVAGNGCWHWSMSDLPKRVNELSTPKPEENADREVHRPRQRSRAIEWLQGHAGEHRLCAIAKATGLTAMAVTLAVRNNAQLLSVRIEGRRSYVSYKAAA